VVLVTLAVATGLPIPLLPAQLLWLNLVTNGIQDVALALERAEPDVMQRRPRSSRERIFDRIMVERTLLAGAVLGLVGLAGWQVWLAGGRSVDEARNLMVQLFVFFEIFHIGNARSERISLFRLSPLRNPILLAGTLSALGVHVAAMYTPFFQRLLGISPLAPAEWLVLGAMAATVPALMESHKLWRRLRPLPAV
jgi:magnesium-transporting ATPase (P-type)